MVVRPDKGRRSGSIRFGRRIRRVAEEAMSGTFGGCCATGSSGAGLETFRWCHAIGEHQSHCRREQAPAETARPSTARRFGGYWYGGHGEESNDTREIARGVRKSSLGNTDTNNSAFAPLRGKVLFYM